MSLTDEVRQTLNLGETGAVRAVGAVFRAVRMSMHADQFNHVREAFPQVEEWLQAAPVAGGRTAEMLAIVGPEALGRSLRDLGLDETQATQLYQLVGRALAQAVPEIAARVKKELPLLG